MLCPSCGTDVGDTIQFCANCRAARPENSAAPSAEPGSSFQPIDDTDSLGDCENAGFWLRFCSSAFDSAIIYLCSQLIAFLMIVVMGAGMLGIFGAWAASGGDPKRASGFLAGVLIGLIAAMFLVLCVVILVGFAYYAGFESSPYRATPGKLLLGMRVVRSDGTRLGLGRALLHHLLRIVSGLLFSLGHLFMLIQPRKQTVYDLALDAMVVRVERVPFWKAVGVFVAAVLIYFAASKLGDSSDKMHRRHSREWERRGVSERIKDRVVLQPQPTAVPATPALPPATTQVPTNAVEPRGPQSEPIPGAPFGEIGVDGQSAPIASTLAFYYPDSGDVAIGFFTEPLDESTREELIRRGNVTTMVNRRRADFVLYLNFPPRQVHADPKAVTGFTSYFYQNPNSKFAFSSSLGAASVSKGKAQFAADEISVLSGTLQAGGKLELGMQSDVTVPNTAVKVRWRIHYLLELH